MKFKLNERGIQQLMNKSHDAMKKTAFRFETLLREDIPVDTGLTKGSIHTIQVAPNRYLIGSNEWSAYVMEHGRKPGKFPNLDALVGWTSRKIGSGQRTSKYDNLTGKEGRELKQTVFLIARSIAKKGIQPKKIFTKSRERHQRTVEQYFYTLMKQNG